MKRFFCSLSLSLSKCVSTKCEDSERREKEKKIWTVFLLSGPFSFSLFRVLKFLRAEYE